MWINFKDYQELAMDELRDKANTLLKKDDRESSSSRLLQDRERP